MADLAGIFRLVARSEPTRRVEAETGLNYGPFWDFCNRVARWIGGVGALEPAVKKFMRARPPSAFVANLQFRHPELWNDLAGTPAENIH